MHRTVVGISSAVMALALGFLAGAWAYGFSQFMWLEDTLGSSDGEVFDYLADTPPAIVTMNYLCLIAMMLAAAGLAWGAWGLLRKR